MARRDFVGIYKPRRAISGGSVLQLKLGSERNCMFLELAPQVRDMKDSKPYDWENQRITVKLGPTDIGKLLALLHGRLPLSDDPKTPDLELFHRNAKGNKVIKIKEQKNGYYVKVSAKEGSKQTAVAVPVSWDEAELLRVALMRGYEIMLGW
jgi:Whirly transcription factor